MTSHKILFLLVLVCASGWGLGRNPVLLVPGWGPQAFTEMERIRTFLEEKGIPAAAIHHFKYPYKRDLGTIRRALAPKIAAVMGQYAPTVKFDVITHSLGHFVAMESILEGGMGARIDTYVGLAGIGMGQHDLPNGCGIASCTAIEPLVPYPSPYAQRLHSKFAAILALWNKCSIYSTDDNVLDNPYYAGALKNGRNFEVHGYRHNDFLRNRNLFEKMWQGCHF